jgi:hypothetical protein
MTKTPKAPKAPKTPKAPPAAKGSVPGDNGAPNGLNDDERGNLFVRELAKLEAVIAKMETLKADVRNQRKRMKSDGFEGHEIDYALKLRKSEDDAMLERRRREDQVARWLAHPIGTQSDFLAQLSTNGGRDPTALGRLAGAEGATCKPPANLTQDDAQRWITGWHAGQASITGGIKAPEAAPDFEA